MAYYDRRPTSHALEFSLLLSALLSRQALSLSFSNGRLTKPTADNKENSKNRKIYIGAPSCKFNRHEGEGGGGVQKKKKKNACRRRKATTETETTSLLTSYELIIDGYTFLRHPLFAILVDKIPFVKEKTHTQEHVMTL